MTNKIALVTGAGSGIGQATATLMASEGAITIVADVDLAAAQLTVEAIGPQAHQAEAVFLDVADDSTWQSVIARILSKHHQLDILVNNAGVSLAKPVVDCTFEEWRQVMAVNLDGVFLGTRHAMDAMTAGGSIINIASVSGRTPFGGAAAYCASKAALRMFSQVVAIECANAQNGIRVNLVTPGGVKTPIWEKQAFFQELVDRHGGTEEAFAAMSGDAHSSQFHSPCEVAESILYLASEASAPLTGAEIVLDRGHSL